MSSQRPLAAFSIYLSGRNEVLLSVAAEIADQLDACAATTEPGPARARASDLMWLWTLGAYEVTRTLCQAQACFSRRFFRDVQELKLELERVRVPSTKMEKINYDRRARAVPVRSDREADVWDLARKDLLVGDPSDLMSARALLARYERVLASLAAEDVLMSHEELFARS